LNERSRREGNGFGKLMPAAETVCFGRKVAMVIYLEPKRLPGSESLEIDLNLRERFHTS